MFAVTYLYHSHNPLSTHPPPLLPFSLFHIQPIIAVADGSLTCSQHAPFPAHVSAAEWVTWADSRWCSLGRWGPLCLLSPLPAQSIIILLRSPLPQDHWRYSGPPSSVPSFTLLAGEGRGGSGGGGVSGLSLGLFIKGASGCSLTCSLDGEPWGSS